MHQRAMMAMMMINNENIVSCHLVILAQTLTIFLPSTDINIACDCIYLDAAPCHDAQNIKRTRPMTPRWSQDDPERPQDASNMASRWLQHGLKMTPRWLHLCHSFLRQLNITAVHEVIVVICVIATHHLSRKHSQQHCM